MAKAWRGSDRAGRPAGGPADGPVAGALHRHHDHQLRAHHRGAEPAAHRAGHAAVAAERGSGVAGAVPERHRHGSDVEGRL